MALELLLSTKDYFSLKCCKFCGHCWMTGENKNFVIIRDIRLLNLLFLLAFGSRSWVMKDLMDCCFFLLILNFLFPERCGEPRISRINLTAFQNKTSIPIETIYWPWQSNPNSYKQLLLTLKSPLCSSLGYEVLQLKKLLTSHINLMNFATVTSSRYGCDSGNSFSKEMKMSGT